MAFGRQCSSSQKTQLRCYSNNKREFRQNCQHQLLLLSLVIVLNVIRVDFHYQLNFGYMRKNLRFINE